MQKLQKKKLKKSEENQNLMRFSSDSQGRQTVRNCMPSFQERQKHVFSQTATDSLSLVELVSRKLLRKKVQKKKLKKSEENQNLMRFSSDSQGNYVFSLLAPKGN